MLGGATNTGGSFSRFGRTPKTPKKRVPKMQIKRRLPLLQLQLVEKSEIDDKRLSLIFREEVGTHYHLIFKDTKERQDFIEELTDAVNQAMRPDDFGLLGDQEDTDSYYASSWGGVPPSPWAADSN